MTCSAGLFVKLAWTVGLITLCMFFRSLKLSLFSFWYHDLVQSQ